MENKITNIEYQKKNKDKVNIYINNQFSFSCTMNFYLDHANEIKINTKLSEELLIKLKNDSMPEEAFSYLCYLSQFTANTEFHMRRKLKIKGFSEKSIDYAIEKGKRILLINDKEILMSIIRNAKSKKQGINKIKEKMFTKGIEINEENLKIISDNISYECFYEMAIEKAHKKLKTIKDSDVYKTKNKLYQYLLGLGFSNDIITGVISDISFENDDNFYD